MLSFKMTGLQGWAAVAMAALVGFGISAFFFLWVAGAVLAKGFWSTLFAVVFFPWGWYLVVEQLFVYTGFISPV